MPVSIEELWMLLGERDTIIFQQSKEIRQLQKLVAEKEKENGELRSNAVPTD